MNLARQKRISRLQVKALGIIRRAQAEGVKVDAGNVVDLVADNTDASLDDIRLAIMSDQDLAWEFGQ